MNTWIMKENKGAEEDRATPAVVSSRTQKVRIVKKRSNAGAYDTIEPM